jgi:hypothetical protein
MFRAGVSDTDLAPLDAMTSLICSWALVDCVLVVYAATDRVALDELETHGAGAWRAADGYGLVSRAVSGPERKQSSLLSQYETWAMRRSLDNGL